MRFPSEPNEAERKSFVDAALQEAARYEPETSAPPDLVAGALARYKRSDNPCGQTKPAPVRLATACGLALLLGGGVWLLRSHPPSQQQSNSTTVTALRPEPKAIVSDASALAHIDLTRVLLPPIDLARFLAASERLPARHRITHYQVRYRHRPRLARNSPPPVQTKRSAGVWTTEIVHHEVVMQTLTPVWVAHADPETQTIALTPALFQLSLQPDDDADSTTPQVGAALIPVRFEQENHQP